MFKHILVPLDGSPLAEQALAPALELAKVYQARLTLLRVATSPQLYLSEFTLGLPDAADLYLQLRQQARLDAENYLELQRSRLEEFDGPVDFRVVESTRIAEAIVETAQEVGADLVVMCTRGRSGIQRWMLGSVAESVLRHATLPILLIRAGEAAKADRSAAA